MRLPVAILAGGLATRLMPITKSIPKALVNVAGEPFAFYQLRRLQSAGIERIVYCVGYLGEQVVAAVGDGSRFGLSIEYVFDGPALVGTGGAIKAALPLLGPTFFVLYGDSYLDVDYAAVGSAFSATECRALMTVLANDGRWDTSNVELANGRIVHYSKTNLRPTMRHIDYGLSVFRTTAFDDVPAGQPVDLATIYEALSEAGQLAALEVYDRFYEVGSFAGIEGLEEKFKAKLGRKV